MKVAESGQHIRRWQRECHTSGTSPNVALQLVGGDIFSRNQVISRINAINEAQEDGAIVRLVLWLLTLSKCGHRDMYGVIAQTASEAIDILETI